MEGWAKGLAYLDPGAMKFSTRLFCRVTLKDLQKPLKSHIGCFGVYYTKEQSLPGVYCAEGQSLPGVYYTEGQSLPGVYYTEGQSLPGVYYAEGQSLLLTSP